MYVLLNTTFHDGLRYKTHTYILITSIVVEWQSSNLTIISEIDNFLGSYFHSNTILIWPFLPDVVDSVHYLGYRLVVGNSPTFICIQTKAEEQLIYF